MMFFLSLLVIILLWTGAGAFTLNRWLNNAIEVQDQMDFYLRMESEQPLVSNAARYFTKRMELYNLNEELLQLLNEKKEQPRHFWLSTVPSFLLLGPILLVPFLRNRIH